MTYAQTISKPCTVSEMTDHDLVNAYQADHNTNAVSGELCNRYRHIIRSFAVRMNAKMSGRFEFDELVQVATMGFLAGLERFETNRGFAIATFIGPHVWNALSTFSEHTTAKATNNSTRVRQTMIALMKIKRARETRNMDVEFSVADLELVAKYTKQSLNIVRKGLVLMHQYESASAVIDDMADYLAADQENAFDELGRTQQSSLTEELLTALPEREAFILRKVVMADEPLTNTEAGEELGLSEGRVRQIAKSALTTLAETCAKRGLEISDLL